MKDDYYFESIEEMQMYVQVNGPFPDGSGIFVGGVRIRR